MEGDRQRRGRRTTQSCEGPCKNLEQKIHWERPIQSTLWVLESPGVLRGGDTVKSLGVTSNSYSYVSESEDGTILLGFALGSPGCHSFSPVSALCLPFPKVPTQFLYPIFIFSSFLLWTRSQCFLTGPQLLRSQIPLWGWDWYLESSEGQHGVPRNPESLAASLTGAHDLEKLSGVQLCHPSVR